MIKNIKGNSKGAVVVVVVGVEGVGILRRKELDVNFLYKI